MLSTMRVLACAWLYLWLNIMRMWSPWGLHHCFVVMVCKLVLKVSVKTADELSHQQLWVICPCNWQLTPGSKNRRGLKSRDTNQCSLGAVNSKLWVRHDRRTRHVTPHFLTLESVGLKRITGSRTTCTSFYLYSRMKKKYNRVID